MHHHHRKAAESSSLSPSPLHFVQERKSSLPRVESLPNLSQLHLKNPTDWSSVVIPQPRKPLHSLLKRAAARALVNAKSDEVLEDLDGVHDEALTELLEIIRSSTTRSGWTTPLDGERDGRDDDDEDDFQQEVMDTPSLSLSPGIPRALGRSKSHEVLDHHHQQRRFDFVMGTPPSRAPNPLAFHCHFASLEQGAELDLLRPSPPIYDGKGPRGSLTCD